MAAAHPLNVALIAGFFVAVAAVLSVLRWARRGASEEDLRAIQADLAGEGGRVVRASRDRSGTFIGRNEYLDEREGGRLYHVTLRVGAVTVRRRVAVRRGRPAVLLP